MFQHLSGAATGTAEHRFHYRRISPVRVIGGDPTTTTTRRKGQDDTCALANGDDDSNSDDVERPELRDASGSESDDHRRINVDEYQDLPGRHERGRFLRSTQGMSTSRVGLTEPTRAR